MGLEKKPGATVLLPLLGETRTAATIANGRLYLRDRENILCLDVKGR
jgi:hypothetical protein